MKNQAQLESHGTFRGLIQSLRADQQAVARRVSSYQLNAGDVVTFKYWFELWKVLSIEPDTRRKGTVIRLANLNRRRINRLGELHYHVIQAYFEPAGRGNKALAANEMRRLSIMPRMEGDAPVSVYTKDCRREA